jgi:hypothetical protein
MKSLIVGSFTAYVIREVTQVDREISLTIFQCIQLLAWQN